MCQKGGSGVLETSFSASWNVDCRNVEAPDAHSSRPTVNSRLRELAEACWPVRFS